MQKRPLLGVFLGGKSIMALLTLINQLIESKDFSSIFSRVGHVQEHLVYGLSGSQKSVLTAALHKKAKRTILYVGETTQKAKEVWDDLNNIFPEKNILFFPTLEVIPYEVLAQSSEVQKKRLQTIFSLCQGEAHMVVATWEALIKTLVPVSSFKKGLRSLKQGESIDVEGLLKFTLDFGYQRVDMISDTGQISIRGGIIDIFSPHMDNPVRIELFDDEIESLRVFDVGSQRSLENLQQVNICPAREFFIASDEVAKKGIEQINKDGEHHLKQLAKQKQAEGYNNLGSTLRETIEKINNLQFFTGMEQLQTFFYLEQATLFDYFSEAPLIVFEEPNRIKEAATIREQERHETFVSLLVKGKLLPRQEQLYLSFNDLTNRAKKEEIIYLALLPKKLSGTNPENLFGVQSKTINLFLGKTRLLADEIKEWQRQKFSIVLLVTSLVRSERLKQSLWDSGIEAAVLDDYKSQPGKIVITIGNLSSGFELPTEKLVLITEHEMFQQPKKKAPKRMFNEGKKISQLEDLKLGDYVVHTNHGIGRYMGVERLDVGQVQRDYLVIKYYGEDKLYVPTDQVSLLQKFVGGEGLVPKVSKLNGSEWVKAKAKVKAAVKEMAEELLKLYASREAQPGFAFSLDDTFQREFEDSFPYQETEDQLKAIVEVKRDMEKNRPMDRLLCGDVGYGKTEVAMRAACKAVRDGKQIAILVPTTILAQQHYNNFIERFRELPVNVEMLSRFKSSKEQKIVAEKVSQGLVDIVIGTHRLLSSDIKFKNLGLLVIDEEQRFGVTHKEKLKKFKSIVDVLTLTATPIPRTLHMSLVGVRDMSVIETPPEDRYPVQTYVVEHSPELLREAIKREIGRGGQVYYVHNRVQDIEETAFFIQQLVPEARIHFAHGQMREDQLEKIMLSFLEGEIDVLVSTTIIETGLDIPNVNTLIIDESDKLGLSQLYQLRGRVGRSNRIAYAYLTYKKDKTLSEIAEKRLSAIREFTELGSGFKIAMRDLEIRGAGNLLGPEQHGHVAAVGFELYCQMLEEAVRELRGQKREDEIPNVLVEIHVDALIPSSYISDSGLKLEFYQRISMLKTREEEQKLALEFKDRFGEPPIPLQSLLRIAIIRILAAKVHVEAINHEQETVKLRLKDKHGFSGQQLMELVRKYRRQVSFAVTGPLVIQVNVKRMDTIQIMDLLEEILNELSNLAHKEETTV